MSHHQEAHHGFRPRRRAAGSRRFRPGLEELERVMLLSGFTVTKETDDLDSSGNPVKGTLRWAITQANQGGGTVTFNIPGAGLHVLTPTTYLPVLASGVTIDGYTQ